MKDDKPTRESWSDEWKPKNESCKGVLVKSDSYEVSESAVLLSVEQFSSQSDLYEFIFHPDEPVESAMSPCQRIFSHGRRHLSRRPRRRTRRPGQNRRDQEAAERRERQHAVPLTADPWEFNGR